MTKPYSFLDPRDLNRHLVMLSCVRISGVPGL